MLSAPCYSPSLRRCGPETVPLRGALRLRAYGVATIVDGPLVRILMRVVRTTTTVMVYYKHDGGRPGDYEQFKVLFLSCGERSALANQDREHADARTRGVLAAFQDGGSPPCYFTG